MHASQVEQDKVIEHNHHFIYFKGLHASADDAGAHRMLLLLEDHLWFV